MGELKNRWVFTLPLFSHCGDPAKLSTDVKVSEEAVVADPGIDTFKRIAPFIFRSY